MAFTERNIEIQQHNTQMLSCDKIVSNSFRQVAIKYFHDIYLQMWCKQFLAGIKSRFCDLKIDIFCKLFNDHS